MADRLKDAFSAFVLRIHQRVYLATNGAIGGRLGGTTCLALTTTGHRSGVERTVVLAYAKDGEDFILVASNDGRDADPAWLWNLRANPAVAIGLDRERVLATARVVGRGEAGYERLLRLANENNRWRYFHYQQRTRRPIPVVVLTPSGEG